MSAVARLREALRRRRVEIELIDQAAGEDDFAALVRSEGSATTLVKCALKAAAKASSHQAAEQVSRALSALAAAAGSEVAPVLWKAVTSRGKPSTRAAAASVALEFGLGDDETRIAFATQFIDTSLVSGDLTRAFKAAAKAAAKRDVPRSPSTPGKDGVAGAVELDFSDDAYRQTMIDTVRSLGSLGEQRWVPWLVEAAKWSSCERDEALAELAKLDLGGAAVQAGVVELIRFVACSSDGELGSVLRSAVTFATREPLLQAALYAALARYPQALRGYAAILAQALTGASARCGTTEATEALEALVSSPVNGASVIAYTAGSGGSFATAVSRTSDPRVVSTLVECAIDTCDFSAAVGSAARAAEERLDHRAANGLRALRWNCEREAEEAAHAGVRFFPPIEVDGELMIPFHRIECRSPPSRWQNDAEEFGLVRITEEGAIETEPIPHAFDATPTGARGAKRNLTVIGPLEGELLLALVEPYSEKGWGDRSYLFSFSCGAGWKEWALTGGRSSSRALTKSPEPIGGGEIVAWIDRGLRLAFDGTPYHLDDWTQSSETVSALSNRKTPSSPPQGPTPRFESMREAKEVWKGTWRGHVIAIGNRLTAGVLEVVTSADRAG